MNLFKLAVAILVSYCVTHVLLVMFPAPLFPHHLTHKNLTVHMREEIPLGTTAVLDRVESLLSASELNDERRHHHVYFINSFTLSRFLVLRNVHFGCNLPIGHSFITSADVASDVARCERLGPNDHRIRTLSGTIAHEITHALIRNHVGWSGDRRLPLWLKEGYCDFIARDSAVDVRTGIALLTNPSGSFTPGLPYFRFRLAIAYLVNVKHMTIDEIIRRPPDFGEVQAEVIAGLREDEQTLLRKLGLQADGAAGGDEALDHVPRP